MRRRFLRASAYVVVRFRTRTVAPATDPDCDTESREQFEYGCLTPRAAVEWCWRQ
ncbi:hypothetical protein ACN9M0_36040 [Streptomyces sp. R-07]|uniref:hypothetical protein n=1 Tax=unclassified Streptomyces TaxID=2593676 RepID=UPI003436548C